MNLKIPDQVVSTIAGKINDQNRYYVLGAVLLFIFILDYTIFTSRQIKNLSKLNPQIALLDKDLKQAHDNILKIDQYQKELEVQKVRLAAIGTTILNREEIPAIMDNISSLATRNKIKINQIMPLKESQKEVLTNDDGKYFSLPIMINAKGSYHDVGRFFNAIENDKIFMNIMDFDMAVSADDPIHHVVTAKIKTFIHDRAEALEAK